MKRHQVLTQAREPQCLLWGKNLLRPHCWITYNLSHAEAWTSEKIFLKSKQQGGVCMLGIFSSLCNTGNSSHPPGNTRCSLLWGPRAPVTLLISPAPSTSSPAAYSCWFSLLHSYVFFFSPGSWLKSCDLWDIEENWNTFLWSLLDKMPTTSLFSIALRVLASPN